MTNETLPSLLRFEPAFMERIWGGRALATHFGLPLPADIPIGEAWLVSDHPVHTSVVIDGPLAGQSLHEIMLRDERALLGKLPKPTVHGRFPLLLKLLDAQTDLSVQVHPDDETAARLGENDGGKTEAWHILHAGRGSELIVGLDPACTPEAFMDAANANALEPHLITTTVAAGDSVFVPSGTVHAIGEDIVLAEIQQNSDVTYRIHDYNRTGPDGKPRTLHLESAREAISFNNHAADKAQPISLPPNGAQQRTLETACAYFAAERVVLDGAYTRKTGERSFHILLAIEGELAVTANDSSARLEPGQSVLLPGAVSEFAVSGTGVLLDYFVADPERDILIPMREEIEREQQAQSFHSDSIRAD